MRTITITIIILILTATPVAALEDGATYYDNGTCIEADGTPGLTAIDGECVTTDDYNELFGYDNLAATPDPLDPSRSIADTAGIVDDGRPAAERRMVFQGVDYGTYTDAVRLAHNIAL